ncbi:hypothetical protein Tco_0316554 [Tanacetum coccineum]
MESVKKLIDERAQHKQEYDSRVNERQMQTTKEKVDTSQAVDASLVNTESSWTESGKQDTSSSSGNDIDADDADIRPVYDEEPMGEVRLTAKNNVFAIGQQHTEQPKFNNEGEVDQNAEQCHDKRPLPAKLNDNQTTDLSNQSLESENSSLKIELRKLKANSVNTKFARTSILGKPVLQPHRNQSVVRPPTAFKFEQPRISKPRFSSQVDVNNDLSKPVTTHYLPKGKESACAKPHHMIAPGSSRYSSNDMVHNHYLDEARKKTQEKGRNSEPSVMPSARLQSTSNGSKPKPRIDNQKSRNWPASKTSYITKKTVPILEHSRNSRKFSDSKHFVCSTCQKCVFNANHDACVTKFLNEVSSRAKFPSYKTTNRNKPVEIISVAKKPERQILTGHRILKTVGLRWVPTEKIFTSSTTTVDSEPLHGSNTDITNLHECIQNLDSSVGSYALSWKPSQRDSLDLPDHRYQVYQGRLLASFQDHAKYEHVGQHTRSQEGKDDKDKQGKDLKISEQKTKSKDNDKGSRSKIT